MSRRNLKQIVFCGRLAPEKGAEDAIRIVAALPEAYRLAIIGDGAPRDALEAQAASLGVAGRVQFHGWLPAGERDALLAESGLLLMPSLCHEGFGMAGIEAFTQGTPAVAYDVGGIAEWCSADAGVLVPCGDIAAATVAIRGIAEDPARWRQFSEAARTVAATRFPGGRFSREILSVIRGATGYTVP
jgi:glycosyltransferase involved in cell wall biosynthesis